MAFGTSAFDAALWAPALGALFLLACSGSVDDDQMVDQDDSSGGLSSTGGGGHSGGQNGLPGGNTSSGGQAAGTGASGMGAGGSETGSGGQASEGSGASGSESEKTLLGRITASAHLTNTLSTRLSVGFTWASTLDGSAESSNECPPTVIGDCFIADCWVEPPSIDVDPRLDAGTIQFTIDNGMTFEATPNPEDNLYTVITQADFFGGELIAFSAEGGTIEPFSGDIHLPLTPMILEPEFSGEDNSVVEVGVPENEDFTLTWDVRGASEYMEFEAIGEPDEPRFSCTFDAQPGGAVIPAEVLQHVGAGTELSAVGMNRDKIVLSNGYVEVESKFDVVNETRTVTLLFVVQ